MSPHLLPNYIDEGWEGFLTPERLDMLEKIDKELTGNMNPERENVLKFFRIKFSGIKVVILGQDPYPQKGVATGRAFEVGGLQSWDQSFRQVSLKNILRLLHKNHRRIAPYEEILPFSRVRQEINQGRFPVSPPHQLFASWEKQGVLLINTSFTCAAGEPGSHEHLWFDFSNQLIAYISSSARLHWFLWGKHAFGKNEWIKNGILHISRHPMLCSQKYEDDFLKSDCFIQTEHLIHWLG